jgi:hypothetical protein
MTDNLQAEGHVQADMGIVRAKPTPSIDEVLQRLDKIELVLNDMARIMKSSLRIAPRGS